MYICEFQIPAGREFTIKLDSEAEVISLKPNRFGLVLLAKSPTSRSIYLRRFLWIESGDYFPRGEDAYVDTVWKDGRFQHLIEIL